MIKMKQARKIIAVSNGAERATYFLGKILRKNANDVFSVIDVQKAEERGDTVTVLLAPESQKISQPALFSVCVMKFEPDKPKPIGFRSVFTYSTRWDGADFTARNIRTLPDETAVFEMVGIGIIGRVRLEHAREGDVEASLAAAAAAMAAGIPFAGILDALNEPDETSAVSGV
jgi:hypothetical protein